MVEDTFQRLSEKQKIFCSKQISSFIEEVSRDEFIVQLNLVKDSSAHRIKTNMTDGTRSTAEAGTKTSSSILATDLDIDRNNSLATTKKPRKPSTKASIMSNSAFKTKGSRASEPVDPPELKSVSMCLE